MQILITNSLQYQGPCIEIYLIYFFIPMKNNKYSDAHIYPIYVSVFDQLSPFLTTDQQDVIYELINNQVHSSNLVLLYALAVHLYGDVDQKRSQQIQDQMLYIDEHLKLGAIQFLNRVCTKEIQMILDQKQAQLYYQYISERSSPLCQIFILSFSLDVDMTNQNSIISKFVLVYFYDVELQIHANSFVLERFAVDDQERRKEFQFLMDTTLNCGQGTYFSNGIVQNLDAFVKFIVNEEKENSSFFIPEKSSINISNLSATIVGTKPKQYLAFFGQGKAVRILIDIFQYEKKLIKKIQISKGYQKQELFLLSKYIDMGSNYRHCKIHELGNQKVIYCTPTGQELILKFSSIVKGYRMITQSSIRNQTKENFYEQLVSSTPDIYELDDSISPYLLADINIIDFLCKKQESERRMKKELRKRQNKLEKETETNSIQFISNIEVTKQNIHQFLQACSLFKMQEELTFKIDVGQHIRITNRVKQSSNVHLIYGNHVELIQLQSIIEHQIPLSQFKNIIQLRNEQDSSIRSITSQKDNIKINLIPITVDTWINKEKFFNKVIKKIQNDTTANFQTVVCTLDILREILQVVKIEFSLIFAINQPIPLIELDKVFNEQTKQMRLKLNKIQFDYYCQMKVDVMNKDYLSSANQQKDEKFLTEIMSNNIHQYEIGNFILSEIDEYNISFMISSNIDKMYFILSQNPNEEFVYLTYHQRLLKIVRNEKGKFIKFEASAMRNLSKKTELVIRPALQRAFLIGQKYVSINLPFQHVKAVEFRDITRLKGNRCLINCYMKKLKESSRYEVHLNKGFNAQYVLKEFSKRYQMKFDDEKIRKQIKSLDIGHGKIEKKRQKPFLCIIAQHQICEKVIQRFLEQSQQTGQKKS